MPPNDNQSSGPQQVLVQFKKAQLPAQTLDGALIYIVHSRTGALPSTRNKIGPVDNKKITTNIYKFSVHDLYDVIIMFIFKVSEAINLIQLHKN